MVKKIRFKLEMPDGTHVGSIDELKEHFDLEAVIGYFKSGKLLTWLQDRYIEDEANAVSELDESTPDFQRRLCAIFEVEYREDIDLEQLARRQERQAKLRNFTDEEEFLKNIDSVAFDQEELADLLDEGCDKIYLCGDHFTIPASQKNKTYVGVNQPKVHIGGKAAESWEELRIAILNCDVENPPKSAAVNAATGRYPESASPKPGGTVSIDSVRPIFRNVYHNLSTFAKIHLLNKAGRYVERDTVKTLQLSDTDLYMLQFMDYGFSHQIPSITIRDNLPSELNRDEKIIAKDILRQSMSTEEVGVLKNMIANVHDAVLKYNCFWPYVSYYLNPPEIFAKEFAEYDEQRKYNWYKDFIDPARKTGWYDLPEPSAEETAIINEYNPDKNN